MGDFSQIRTRLDIQKARTLTDTEASNAFQRISKYRTLLKSRPITKLSIDIILNPFVPTPQDYYGQLLFQYNVAMPKSFCILNTPLASIDIRGCITVKWRVGTTVYRYFLHGTQNYLVQIPHVASDNYQLHNFPSYSGQQVPKNCCFEYWSARFNLFSTDYGDYGLPNGFTIMTNRLRLPDTVDDTSDFAYNFDAIDKNDFDIDLPEDIPTIQPTIAWNDNV